MPIQHYDRDGKSSGFSKDDGNDTINHYDRDGNSIGFSRDTGNGCVEHFDKDGFRAGFSKDTDRGYTEHYDRDGYGSGFSQDVGNGYTSHYDDTGSSSGCSKDSDDGGCYLTTACMAAHQGAFRDDCHELTTLRRFRDSFVKETHPGDAGYYDAVAPGIVRAVDKRPDRAEIYADMYRDLVLSAVRLIEQGRLSQAYALYREYSLALEARFLR